MWAGRFSCPTFLAWFHNLIQYNGCGCMQFQLHDCDHFYYGKKSILSRLVVDLAKAGLIFEHPFRFFSEKTANLNLEHSD